MTRFVSPAAPAHAAGLDHQQLRVRLDEQVVHGGGVGRDRLERVVARRRVVAEHGFEKPLELCKFLIGKHSFEGELVVDLCGCTGTMSLAAIDMNRPWLYVESNPANYQIGAGRLAERLWREHAEAS